MTVPLLREPGFNPHVQHIAQGEVLGLCEKHLGLVVLHRLAEQGLRFALALRSGKLLLDAVAAGVLDVKAVIPLLSLFSNRTFCHSCTPFDGGKGRCRDVMVIL